MPMYVRIVFERLTLVALGLTAAMLTSAAYADGHAAEALDASVEVATVAVAERALSPALQATATVESVTAELIELIEAAQSYVDEDEQRFYAALGVTLNKYVDFPNFSRAVMGRYASSKKMESLDDAGRAVLQGQIDRFEAIFQQSLINTYGKGLLVFEGERIEVVPPTEGAEEKARAGKAMVKQLIFGEREQPFEIFYSLRTNDSGEWKIRNMIVEASNLGKLYRNQFANAYKVYEGDIDKVIDNWAGGEG